MPIDLKEKFFKAALIEANKAARKDEVPIGAVLTLNNRIIARAHNLTEKTGSFLCHAELLCLQKAAKKLKSKYLLKSQLYITLEPCLMCEYAAKLCRVESIYFLARSDNFGRKGRAYFKSKRKKLNFAALSEASVHLLKDFFKRKR